MRKIRSLICLMAICLLSCFVFSFNTITAFAYVTIAAEIPVSCLEIPDDKTHTYTIIIESENEVSPAPKSDKLEITENGTGKFEIDIDEPGTFMYRIYEKPGNEHDVEYDDNEYIVTVFVENANDNELKYAASATVSGSDKKPESIVFENKNTGSDEGDTTPERTDTSSRTTDTTSSTAETDSSSSAAETSDRTTSSTSSGSGDTSSSVNDNNGNPFTGFIDDVLTGDSVPAHAVRATMLLSILTAISTFLFKRDNNEEEDKNEE